MGCSTRSHAGTGPLVSTPAHTKQGRQRGVERAHGLGGAGRPGAPRAVRVWRAAPSTAGSLRRAHHQRTAHRLSGHVPLLAGRADGRRQGGERRFLPASRRVDRHSFSLTHPHRCPYQRPSSFGLGDSTKTKTPRTHRRGRARLRGGAPAPGEWQSRRLAIRHRRHGRAARHRSRRDGAKAAKVVTALPAPEPHRSAPRRAARAARSRVVPSQGRVTRAL